MRMEKSVEAHLSDKESKVRAVLEEKERKVSEVCKVLGFARRIDIVDEKGFKNISH